jgi:hypothetical protein
MAYIMLSLWLLTSLGLLILLLAHLPKVQRRAKAWLAYREALALQELLAQRLQDCPGDPELGAALLAAKAQAEEARLNWVREADGDRRGRR